MEKINDKTSPSINDIKIFENLYDTHRSLNIVAELSGWCPTTVKKYEKKVQNLLVIGEVERKEN